MKTYLKNIHHLTEVCDRVVNLALLSLASLLWAEWLCWCCSTSQGDHERFLFYAGHLGLLVSQSVASPYSVLPPMTVVFLRYLSLPLVAVSGLTLLGGWRDVILKIGAGVSYPARNRPGSLNKHQKTRSVHSS